MALTGLAKTILLISIAIILISITLPGLLDYGWRSFWRLLVVPPPPPTPGLLSGWEKVNYTISKPQLTTVTLETGDKINLTMRHVWFGLGIGHVKVHGVILYRSDLVEKAPGVLLFHGLGGSVEQVMRYAVHLAAQGLVVMAIDLPGHGASGVAFHASYVDALPDPNPVTNLLRQAYLAGLRAATVFLDTGLVNETIVAVGGSLGGLVAFTTACLHENVDAAVVFEASGCIECSLAEGKLGLALVGGHRVPRILDPLAVARLCNIGKTAVFVLPSHDAYFTISGLEELTGILKTLDWKIIVDVEPNAVHEPPELDKVLSYTSFALKLLEEPQLADYVAPPSPAWIPFTVLASSDIVAVRLSIAALPYTVFQPPGILASILPQEVIAYNGGYGVEASSFPRAYGVYESLILLAIAVALMLRSLAFSSEVRGVGLAVIASSAIAPSAIYSLPVLVWPGVMFASVSQVQAISLSLFNIVSPVLVMVSPIIAALALASYYQLKPRLAKSLVTGYAVVAALPIVFARIQLALAGLGPGVPPFSPFILSPVEAVPALIAYMLHVTVGARILEARAARRPRRRRIRLAERF